MTDEQKSAPIARLTGWEISWNAAIIAMCEVEYVLDKAK